MLASGGRLAATSDIGPAATATRIAPYPERDGRFPELDSRSATSSELLQRHLPQSRVVQVFNDI
ncbi:hypothetical protein AB0D32_31845 [Micromonospora sp. NPDC048170]|uniref:hypothetical protein n=1 Tax=Micromonospora sp. NPDC048170 TaxID=3154819 RepID=UPI0033DB223C